MKKVMNLKVHFLKSHIQNVHLEHLRKIMMIIEGKVCESLRSSKIFFKELII